MINVKEVEQGSLEWFELKWGKIGGTASSGLRVKSETLFIDILSQRGEEFEFVEGYESDAISRGHDLEPFAREYIGKFVGVEFEQTGWLQSEENVLMGISPDGITADETKCCEIKCLSRKKHWEILLKNEIPKEYVDQVIQYFTVNPKLEELHFIAYRPESGKPFIQKVTRATEFDLGEKKKVEVPQISEKTGKPIASKWVTERVLTTVADACESNMEMANELLSRIEKVEEANQSNF